MVIRLITLGLVFINFQRTKWMLILLVQGNLHWFMFQMQILTVVAHTLVPYYLLTNINDQDISKDLWVLWYALLLSIPHPALSQLRFSTIWPSKLKVKGQYNIRGQTIRGLIRKCNVHISIMINMFLCNHYLFAT